MRSYHSTPRLAFLGYLLALTTHSSGQNWPSFRGTNGDGIGTGSPPTTWNVQTRENVKWKVRLPGLGHSSPIVWGDRVFVTTAVPMAGNAELSTGWLDGSGDSAKEEGEWEWKLLSIDAKTGQAKWEFTAHKAVPKFKRHAKASHANSTPATDGKHVVASFGPEGLFCCDMEGQMLWKKDLGIGNAGPVGLPDLQWGFASSPIIHDGKVIMQVDVQGSSYWSSLDIKTGKELLRIERGDDPTWCTPSVHVGKDRTTLICNGYKKMAGYDLASGKELWMLQGGGDVPVPRPVVANDRIFLTNGHGRRPIYVVRADAQGDVTPSDERKPDGLVWWNRGKGSYMPTPIVVGDVFYVADDGGIFTAFDAATGKQIFRERLPGGGKSTYSASPVSANGLIYVTSEDGQVDIVTANSEGYVHVASNQVGEICMATPAISNGWLFIRGKDHLFCIAK